MLWALSSALVATSPALGQPSPRIDPGSPPEPSTGSFEGWEILTIPNLPPGSVLGDIHVSANGVVHVWAKVPPKAAADGLEETGEGERIPDQPNPSRVATSILYRFDGAWTTALRTPGEEGLALLGGEGGLLFASTVNALGEAQLYHFNGASWNREPMPGLVLGRMHTLAGVPGDMYFRVDRAILHHDGKVLRWDYILPAEGTPVRGLVYLESSCMFVMGTQGHWIRHEGGWSEIPAGFAFDAVGDAWGMRDAQGRLQMFAVGSDAARCGLRLWRFSEEDQATHAGTWSPVLADPPTGGYPDVGVGLHLWGIAENEVYATGVVEGEGHFLRFDGNTWIELSPPARFGTVHGVWGTPGSSVWFSTESGNVVHYLRANRPPDLTAAHATVTRLWPPDLGYVPVEVAGIVDLDGDAMKIEVTRVTQDEALVTDGHVDACPDAMLMGSRVYLRAEHAAGGDGRTYDVEYTATDRLGATSRGHVQVFAPHFVSAPCEPDPATFDALAPCAVSETERRGPLKTDLMQGSLRISYELERSSAVHLGVYDVSGRVRAVVAEGVQGPGAHETQWSLDRLEPGVYFVKLRTQETSHVRRVIVGY